VGGIDVTASPFSTSSSSSSSSGGGGSGRTSPAASPAYYSVMFKSGDDLRQDQVYLSTVLPWCIHSTTMVYPQYYHGVSTVLPWCIHSTALTNMSGQCRRSIQCLTCSDLLLLLSLSPLGTHPPSHIR
jgi:hypothetical protein